MAYARAAIARARGANHLADLAGTRARSTLTGRLVAIVRAHRLLGVPSDAADRDLRETLARIARTHGTRPRRRGGRLSQRPADRRRRARSAGRGNWLMPRSEPGELVAK